MLGTSELILNADKSIYHLNLLPSEIADIIITVGDPDRVAKVSKHFDTIEHKKGKREFITHTGFLAGKRISVVSTGIGTDNVDIVLNELDALANIEFDTRTVKLNTKSLKLIRIGTSGALQPDIPVDSFLLSEMAIGLDPLMHYYQYPPETTLPFTQAMVEHLGIAKGHSLPYIAHFDDLLAKKFVSNRIRLSNTLTNSGFYGPQGRKLRLAVRDEHYLDKLVSFTFEGKKFDNMEMETSGLYALSKLMGHKAVSLNCILANRVTGSFSKNAEKAIGNLIQYALEKIISPHF